jgi:hypothetical protein
VAVLWKCRVLGLLGAKWREPGEVLQKTTYSIFSFRNFINRRAAEAKKYPRCMFLFTYIYLGHPLEKFVVSAFFTTKVCSVHLLRLQKFVESTFETTRVFSLLVSLTMYIVMGA